MKDKKGRFIKGNPGGALKQPAEHKTQVLTDVAELQDDISTLRRSGYARILKKFKNLSQMDLATFERMGQHKERLSIEDAAFMSFFNIMIKTGNVNHMRFYFATYGIPTELKAIAVQDMDGLLKNSTLEDSAFEIEMSDDETLLMLDKMKDIVKNKK